MNKNKWIWILIVAAVVVSYQKMQQGRQGRAADAVPTQTQPQTQAEKRQSEQSESKKSQPKQPKSDRQAGQGSAEQILQQAFENQQSDIQVKGAGTVLKTLPDDNQGTRHQRFILKLSSGQTLLVAHNIDLADKIKGLKKGDKVGFYGEYEWSEQGGVLHWTHHDPAGRHADGWLEHNGRVYQ
ncbi:DUF3465 domain-containing protein [Neisseria mucosa]